MRLAEALQAMEAHDVNARRLAIIIGEQVRGTYQMESCGHVTAAIDMRLALDRLSESLASEMNLWGEQRGIWRKACALAKLNGR